jgi:hypothetical protein
MNRNQLTDEQLDRAPSDKELALDDELRRRIAQRTVNTPDPTADPWAQPDRTPSPWE